MTSSNVFWNVLSGQQCKHPKYSVTACLYLSIQNHSIFSLRKVTVAVLQQMWACVALWSFFTSLLYHSYEPEKSWVLLYSIPRQQVTVKEPLTGQWTQMSPVHHTWPGWSWVSRLQPLGHKLQMKQQPIPSKPPIEKRSPKQVQSTVYFYYLLSEAQKRQTIISSPFLTDTSTE